MKRFTIHTVSGETERVLAERYEVNRKTGCVDFFDDKGRKVEDPVFFFHGVAYIKEERLKRAPTDLQHLR
ncbi:MAG TPA: hypothetical protein VFD58_27045 [Blastocatellia bacterium]|nr:hypothetical protein [Blastocatellia bacterium]